jgi:hypothetical protein
VQVFYALSPAADTYELEPCRANEEYDGDAVLVALQAEATSGCGHFTRLFRVAEWESMQAAAVVDPEGTSNDNSDESEDSDESSSSSLESESAKPSKPEIEEEKPSSGSALKLDTPPCAKPVVSVDADNDLEWESLSEAEDDADFHDVCVDPEKDFTTREDTILDRIDELAARLRDKPLLPCDPRDKNEAYMNLQSGVRLPLLHCAFKGCTWSADLENNTTIRHWTLEWVLFLPSYACT